MKKLLALLLALSASCTMLASCSGSSDDSYDSEDRAATETTTTTRRTTTSRRSDDSRSLMSSAESRADELGEDVADGIDNTLSTAGDVADDILR
ncbi:MAG: hypothetical protein IJ746_08040 [Ruminococcus sp.]|nr:hypothetical protein [Ruminococcus sp.]